MVTLPTDYAEILEEPEPEPEFVVQSGDLLSLEQNFPELRNSIEEPSGEIEVQLAPPLLDLLTEHRRLGFGEAYDLTASPRGRCMIINNKMFKSKKHEERIGTDIDCANLKSLFQKLDYAVVVHLNLKAKEMMRKCEEFILHPEQAGYSSCVLVILSHGELGKIVGSDSRSVKEADIIGLFNHPDCKLGNKPKLVIIQACRTQLKDPGLFCFGDNTADTASEGQETEEIVNMIQYLRVLNYKDEQRIDSCLAPDNADIMIAHSTLPGYFSWRNRRQGSWFIQAIVQVFGARCSREHVADMLVMVNDVVSRAFGNGRCSQQPCPINHLRKKLYFFPNNL